MAIECGFSVMHRVYKKQQYFVRTLGNLNFKRIVVIFVKQRRERTAKLSTQLLSVSSDQCCYFTLQNEMVAIWAMKSKPAKCKKIAVHGLHIRQI